MGVAGTLLASCAATGTAINAANAAKATGKQGSTGVALLDKPVSIRLSAR